MNRMIAVLLVALLTNPSGASALQGHKAAYAGGTIARFNTSGKRIEGRVEIGPREFTFVADGSPLADEPLRIEYASVHHLEFGQRVSRRTPLVIGATVALGPFGLLSLPARRRAHYLTVAYANDSGGTEVVIIELGKDVVRSLLTDIETRTGIAIEYQDDEARKWRR
jgi:hypothetical protein